MSRKTLAIAVVALAMLLPGCSKQGPTGPEGPGGPGIQTVHTQAVTPTAASGRVEIAASEIVVDPGCDCSSTVLCYATFTSETGSEVPLPTTRLESDGTHTIYNVEVRAGKVTITWQNSQSTIPDVATFIVTVVNKE